MIIVSQGATVLPPGEKHLVPDLAYFYGVVCPDGPLVGPTTEDVCVAAEVWFNDPSNLRAAGIWILELGYGTAKEGLALLKERPEVNDPNEAWCLPKSWNDYVEFDGWRTR